MDEQALDYGVLASMEQLRRMMEAWVWLA